MTRSSADTSVFKPMPRLCDLGKGWTIAITASLLGAYPTGCINTGRREVGQPLLILPPQGR